METPVVKYTNEFLDGDPTLMEERDHIASAETIGTHSKYTESLPEEDSSTVASTNFHELQQHQQQCCAAAAITVPPPSTSAAVSQNNFHINDNNPKIPNNENSLSKLVEISWQPIHKELLKVLRMEEGDDEATISMFRSLHEAGIAKNVLHNIAHLSLTTTEWTFEREKAFDSFAAFLVSETTSHRAKLGCIRTLMVLRTPIDASWQLEEACLKETLSFVLHREQEWMLPTHSDCALLWDLRARCLRYQELSPEDFKLELDDVVKGGEETAKYIAYGAKWFKKNLKLSLVPVVDYGLDTAGDSLKSCLTPADAMLTPRRRSAVTLAADCTALVRQASTGVRLKAKTMSGGIRSLPLQGFRKAVEKIEEDQLIAKMVPNEDQREVLTVAGKVGVASVGAAAIVSEAIVETTAAVVSKTVSVTADVVSYKYGDSAGQIIKDTSITTGNVLRTIGHLAGLQPDPEGMTKMVAKNASKDQIQAFDHSNKLLDEKPLDPLFLLDSDRYEANIVVKKLKDSAQTSDEDIQKAAVVFI